MGNIVLAYANAIDDASFVVQAGNSDAGFGPSLLSVKNFAKGWRKSPSNGQVAMGARFKLASPVISRAMALSGHNLSEDAYYRYRAGSAPIDYDFMSKYVMASDIVATGGANGKVTDENRQLLNATAPRYNHENVVWDNFFSFSDDLTNTSSVGWIASSSDVLDYETVHFSGAGSYLTSGGQGAQKAGTYTLNFKALLMQGNGDLNGFAGGSSGSTFGAPVTVTKKWARYSVTINITTYDPNQKFGLQKLTAGGTIKIKNLQLVSPGTSLSYFQRTNGSFLMRKMGLLLEPARTNYLLSSMITHGGWSTTSTAPITGVSGGGTRYGGLTYAWSLGSYTAGQYFRQDVTIASLNTFDTCYAADFDLNPGAYSYPATFDIAIDYLDGASAVLGTVSGTFTPATSTFTTSTPTASGSATAKVLGVIPLEGNLVRLFVSGRATSGSTAKARVRITANAAGDIRHTMHQLENGATPTSPILTTTAAVTRTVDGVEIPFSALGLANTDRVTLFAEILIPTIRAADGTVASIALLGSTKTSLQLKYSNAAGGYVARAVVDTGGSTSADSALLPLGSVVRIAFVVHSGTTASLFINGVKYAMTGSFQSFSTVKLQDNVAQNAFAIHVRRVTEWRNAITDAQATALTTGGLNAVDIDTGWLPAMQMSDDGVIAEDWGTMYDVISIAEQEVRVSYGSIEIYDPVDHVVQIGRMFIGRFALQPAENAEWGVSSGWNDLTTQNVTTAGRKFFDVHPRIRYEAFNLPYLTEEESDQLHRMIGYVGVSEEVLYVRDPDDLPGAQQYGFLGYLSQLDPLKLPQWATYEMAFQMEKKL